MNDPGDEKTDPDDASASPLPEDELQVDNSQDDDLYAVAEPDPEPPGLETGTTTPAWYLGAPDGQREGPLSLAEMKQRVASGRLDRQRLVWKSGMPGWVPAGTVPELFETPATPGSPPPPALFGTPIPGTAAVPAASAIEWVRRLDGLFASPVVYRMTGRVCAALGVLTLLVALVLLIARSASWTTWLTGFLLFALIFLAGEAAGAILAILGRIETGSMGRGPSEKHDQ